LITCRGKKDWERGPTLVKIDRKMGRGREKWYKIRQTEGVSFKWGKI